MFFQLALVEHDYKRKPATVGFAHWPFTIPIQFLLDEMVIELKHVHRV